MKTFEELLKEPRFKNLTNGKFGKWTALECLGRDKNRTMWRCRCDCGKEKVVSSSSLVFGSSKSCGCLIGDALRERLANTPRKICRDLTGQRFGKTVVLEYAGYTGRTKRRERWICKCDCGRIRDVSGETLLRGKSTSCGKCGVHRTHGLNGTPEYICWAAMLQRCINPASAAYANYGGRGIKVCDRWLSAENFAADMGPRPKGKSLDRIDPNGHYEPSNCRWATTKEQSRNKRNTKWITIDGVTKTLPEWCELSGLRHSVITARIARGWPEPRWLEPIKIARASPVRH